MNSMSKSFQYLIVQQQSHQQQKPYLMKQEKQDVDLIKLRKISQKKQKIQNRLEEISTYEKKYEDDINLKKIMRDRNYSTLRAKSELTKEDALKLKKLKQQQRSFEKDLQEKTKNFQEKELAYKMEQKELQQRKIQEKNQKKKQQIAKRLQEMAEKRNFRQMRYEEQKKQLTKLKVQKKMFEQLNENFEKSEQTEKMKKIEEYEQRLKQKMIDLNSLKQHQQKYQQVLKQKKQELAHKRLQASRLHRSSLNSQHKSKFYTIIMEEQARAKRQQFEKKNQNKQVASRMRGYGEIVKRDFIPKVKTKSDEDEETSVKQSRVAADFEEVRKMGLNNLELCKSLASKSKKNRKIRLEDLDKTPPKNRYTDYLSETRKTRQQKSEGHSTHFSKSFKHDVDEVRKIMKEKNCSEVQKVQQIRRLAQKIDATPQNLRSDGMLNKIAAKIELLQALK